MTTSRSKTVTYPGPSLAPGVTVVDVSHLVAMFQGGPDYTLAAAGRAELERLQDYYDRCAAADWSYAYSDSASVYNRGRDQITALRREAHGNKAMEEMFSAYNDYESRIGPHPERPK